MVSKFTETGKIFLANMTNLSVSRVNFKYIMDGVAQTGAKGTEDAINGVCEPQEHQAEAPCL